MQNKIPIDFQKRRETERSKGHEHQTREARITLLHRKNEKPGKAYKGRKKKRRVKKLLVVSEFA